MIRALHLAILSLALAGCDQNMERQEKVLPYEPAGAFADGSAMQPPVPGTVAQEDVAPRAALAKPPPLTEALLERGADRYRVFCSPCHGDGGWGDGRVPARGYPDPPSFHAPRLRQASPAYIVSVVTDGYGVMYSYAGRVAPRDRWAIAAHVKALQLAVHAPVATLPEDVRARLGGTGE